MDKDRALEVQRALWSDADSPGLPGMQMLAPDVCAYDLVIGEVTWFHKSNTGSANDWTIGAGKGANEPDIVVHFDGGLNYPFCFEHCTGTEELIGAFRAEAERGLIWFEPKRDMSELVTKGYDKVAEALGLQAKPGEQAA